MKKRWIVIAALLVVMLVAVNPVQGRENTPAGIVSVDSSSPAELYQKLAAGYVPQITWFDAYSKFVDVHTFIPDIDVEDAWAYVSDIRNLQQWTMSVRNIQQMPDLNGKTRYQAYDPLGPSPDGQGLGGPIYFLEKINNEDRTVDWWVGHSPEDIWMYYYMRVQDAKPLTGKAGVILTWENFSHANFLRDEVLQTGFLMMPIAHGLERDNLVKILKYRAQGHTGDVTVDVMRQLGLINVELCDPDYLFRVLIFSQIRPSVAWEEYYNNFIGSHFFLPGVSADAVYRYLSVPEHMAKWTVSMRNIRALEGNRFEVVERLLPHGRLVGEMQLHPQTKTIDILMGPMGAVKSDGTSGLWITETFRVCDGMSSNGQEGAVVIRINFRHSMYDEMPELWRYLPVRNKFEAQNLAVILKPAM